MLLFFLQPFFIVCKSLGTCLSSTQQTQCKGRRQGKKRGGPRSCWIKGSFFTFHHKPFSASLVSSKGDAQISPSQTRQTPFLLTHVILLIYLKIPPLAWIWLVHSIHRLCSSPILSSTPRTQTQKWIRQFLALRELTSIRKQIIRRAITKDRDQAYEKRKYEAN